MRAASSSPRVARARARAPRIVAPSPPGSVLVGFRLARRSRAAPTMGILSPPPTPSPPLARPRVVYEDDELLALDKPPGASFHGDDLEHGRPGVLALTRALQREGLLEGTEYAGDLHAVHRLDKLTSGILLLAKRRDVAAAALAREFRERRVVKVYVALTARRPKKKMGTVRGVMTRARRGGVEARARRRDGFFRSFRPVVRESPREAKPSPKFVSRGLAPAAAGRGSGRPSRPLRLMTLRPLTGKTHQLRVACKSLGAPILGDARYADKTEAEREDRYLHAAAMRLAVPSRMTRSRMRAARADRRDRVSAERRSGVGDGRVPVGVGGDGARDSDVWFPESPLLRSTRAELLT